MTNKKINYAKMTDAEIDKYKEIFGRIYAILYRNNHIGQANHMLKLTELLENNQSDQFMQSINGLSLWGGAGAVWEVYIENKNEAKAFELEIIELINLMEDTKILGRGIKPIRDIFKKLNKV